MELPSCLRGTGREAHPHQSSTKVQFCTTITKDFFYVILLALADADYVYEASTVKPGFYKP